MPLARLSDAISQQLGIDIVRGLYAIGEAIPTETTLARQWNVSRTAVREGIRILASKGLIETRTRAGTTVRPRSQWHLLDPTVLTWMRQAEPDGTFMHALIELRLIIEPPAAALAAKRRTTEDLAQLGSFLDIMRDPNRTEEAARRADIQFHRVIMSAAGNHALIPLAASIEAAVTASNTCRGGRNMVRHFVPEHQCILDALKRQDDAEARWRMEALIRSHLKPRQTQLMPVRA